MRSFPTSDYYNLTSQEFSNLVTIVARLFIGNNLMYYLVKTNQGMGYILCDTYDNICGKFKVFIDDKSSIKRISFKTPQGLDIDSVKMNKYPNFSLEPTDTSKQDALSIFSQGIFQYSRKQAKQFEMIMVQLLTDYCTKIKYADDIKERRKELQAKGNSDLLEKLYSASFIAVYDNSLNEITCYVAIDDNSLIQTRGAYGGRVQIKVCTF